MAPVVSTSSQTTIETGTPARGEAGALGGAHPHGAGQVGRPLSGVEACLVQHTATHLEQTSDDHDGTVATHPSSGGAGDPEHRVVSAGAHHLRT